MRMNCRITTLLILLLSAKLQAQDFSFGGQLTLSRPLGDLSSSSGSDQKIGYGFGVHGVIGMSEGHSIIPRVDYLKFSRNDGSNLNTNLLMVGVDYAYFTSKKVNDGLFLSAGAGYGSAQYKASGFLGPDRTKNSGSLYWAVGAGYMFTPNLGGELRYSSAEYETVPWAVWTKPKESAPTLCASVIIRF